MDICEVEVDVLNVWSSNNEVFETFATWYMQPREMCQKRKPETSDLFNFDNFQSGWHENLIQNGKWPNGTKVIVNDLPLSGCSIGSYNGCNMLRYGNDVVHFNHYHLSVKGE